MNTVPDPTVDPLAALTLLQKLYHSGLIFDLGILVVFFALKYASTHIAWLKVGYRAVMCTALIAGLGMLVQTAAAGGTLTILQVSSAIGAVVTLMVNPKAVITGATALVMLVMMPLQGCATVSQDANVVKQDIGSDVIDCGKAEGSAFIAANGQTAVQAAVTVGIAIVGAITSGGLAAAGAVIAAMIPKYGEPFVACVAHDLEAQVAAANAGSGAVPGIASVSRPAPNPVLGQLIAAHGWKFKP